jgi:hypothetical protein
VWPLVGHLPGLRGSSVGASLAIAATALALAATPGLAAPTQVPVKAKPPPVSEQDAAAGPGYLAWDQNTRSHPHLFDEYYQHGGGGRVRVNPAGTQAFGGGIGGTTLVYQQVHDGGSDLRLFDLATHVRSLPPAGIDTSGWEWHPTISGPWILFGRIGHTGTQRVLLANTSTHELRVLDTRKNGQTAEPGQVRGDLATWDRCATRCNVFVYRISTATATKVPNPLRRFQFAPSADSAGNVFYIRSGRRCGRAATLMELPSGGTPRTLLALHPGTDAGFTYVSGSGASETVMFDKYHCSSATWDVFRIAVP